ncbi:hypothetical protein [Blastococcus saxobsidens]|uniref:Uncharacterized protein n=1 Tax=Blastococcus saxobsidens TaxID=138336 RepID=A0A4Q7Y9B6_9ACTN|nr:hypothetical protein [Blastococcus saxobsidens]RZU32635.1 hypothetical protein BKA19_2330 [Blastococcus saxobsidens]
MTVVEPNAAPMTADGDGTMPALPGDAAMVEDDAMTRSGADTVADPGAAAGNGGGGVGTAVEDWLAGQTPTGARIPITPIPIPDRPVLPVRMRQVSGCYRSPAGGFQLELRVDVDGRRPLKKLSGDYFSASGATLGYFGSWTVDGVTTSVSNGALVAVGTARCTWPTTYTVARVTIPRRTVFQAPAPATIQWCTPSGAVGATYVCAPAGTAMRVVELEQDVEAGVTPFASYDTGSLTSGGPARTLTAATAYGEAGIQVLDTGGTTTLATAAGHVWNNASLHGAMTAHFSRWQERAQFKVWLLHAQRHELGTGLRGIMFDQQGLQRQGCASFYQVIQAGTPQNLREQLYVAVHELGHCFNLFHSFHKSFMTPPLPNRPGSLSWMNYPQNYNPGGGAPSGAAAFWGAFPFQFDDLELAHLRHGFRDNVIMGGTPFGSGAALEMPAQPPDPVSDTSGLRLRLRTSPARPVLGTPVVLELELTVDRGQLVHPAELLHPKYGIVQVTISRPKGDTVVHRPPVLHCAEPELVAARPGQVLPASAYIGYDAAVGQVFEDPGTYRIRATYTAPDGSVVVSDSAMVRVWGAGGAEDGAVAELLLGDEVGMAMTLLGSDAPSLATGMESLQEIAEEHGDHPDAVYARLALGINAARPYTAVAPDGSVAVRDRDLDRADALLQPAIDASRGRDGLDDLTLLQVMGYLARSHAAEGDRHGARELRRDAGRLAADKQLPDAALTVLDEGEDG